MSDSNQNRSSSVPRDFEQLSGSNFPSWRRAIQEILPRFVEVNTSILYEYALYSAEDIFPDPPIIPDKTKYSCQIASCQKQRIQYNKDNGFVFALLMSSLSEDFKLLVKDDITHIEEFKTLHAKADGIGFYRLIESVALEVNAGSGPEVRAKWSNMRPYDNEHIRLYLRRFDDVVEQLEATGTKVEDHHKVETLRSHLSHDKYKLASKSLYDVYNHTAEGFPTYLKVCTELLIWGNQQMLRDDKKIRKRPLSSNGESSNSNSDDVTHSQRAFQVRQAREFNELKNKVNQLSFNNSDSSSNSNSKSRTHFADKKMSFNNNNQRNSGSGRWNNQARPQSHGGQQPKSPRPSCPDGYRDQCTFCSRVGHDGPQCLLISDQEKSEQLCTKCNNLGHITTMHSIAHLPFFVRSKPQVNNRKPNFGSGHRERGKMIRSSNKTSNDVFKHIPEAAPVQFPNRDHTLDLTRPDLRDPHRSQTPRQVNSIGPTSSTWTEPARIPAPSLLFDLNVDEVDEINTPHGTPPDEPTYPNGYYDMEEDGRGQRLHSYWIKAAAWHSTPRFPLEDDEKRVPDFAVVANWYREMEQLNPTDFDIKSGKVPQVGKWDLLHFNDHVRDMDPWIKYLCFFWQGTYPHNACLSERPSISMLQNCYDLSESNKYIKRTGIKIPKSVIHPDHEINGRRIEIINQMCRPRRETAVHKHKFYVEEFEGCNIDIPNERIINAANRVDPERMESNDAYITEPMTIDAMIKMNELILHPDYCIIVQNAFSSDDHSDAFAYYSLDGATYYLTTIDTILEEEWLKCRLNFGERLRIGVLRYCTEDSQMKIYQFDLTKRQILFEFCNRIDDERKRAVLKEHRLALSKRKMKEMNEGVNPNKKVALVTSVHTVLEDVSTKSVCSEDDEDNDLSSIETSASRHPHLSDKDEGYYYDDNGIPIPKNVSAFMAKGRTHFKKAFKVPNVISRDLIVDSGASITVEIGTTFVTQPIKNDNPSVCLEAVNGEIMQVTHVGRQRGTGSYMVVPSATQSLASVPEMSSYGHEFVFFQDKYGNNKFKITSPSGVKVYGAMNEQKHYILSRKSFIRLQQSDTGANTYDVETAFAFRHRASVVPRIDGITPTVVNTTKTMTVINSDKSKRQVLDVQHVAAPATLTADENARADEVMLLHNMFHCSNSTLFDSLTYGVISGSNLLPGDVALMVKKYGLCNACIAGKYVKQSFKHNSSNLPATQVGGCVHVDIYVIHDTLTAKISYYLISVDELSTYLTFCKLTSKETQSLCDAFYTLESIYKAKGHTIKCIQSDAEVCISSCRTYLGMRGIELRQVPPYQHAQRIERHVRTVNDRVRTILSGLEYYLPHKLYVEVIYHTIQILNDLPNSNTGVNTPRTLFGYDKCDLSKRLLIPFGQIGMASCAGKDQNNRLPNAELGIVLGPSFNTYGSVRFYVAESMEIVDRSDITPSPEKPTHHTFRFKRVGLQTPINFEVIKLSRHINERHTVDDPTVVMRGPHRIFPHTENENQPTNVNKVYSNVSEVSSEPSSDSLPNLSLGSRPREGDFYESSHDIDVPDAKKSRVNTDNVDQLATEVRGSDTTHVERVQLPIVGDLFNNNNLNGMNSDIALNVNNSNVNTMDAVNTVVKRKRNKAKSTTHVADSPIVPLESTNTNVNVITNKVDLSNGAERRLTVDSQSVISRRGNRNESKSNDTPDEADVWTRRSTRNVHTSWVNGPPRFRGNAKAYQLSVVTALKSDRAKETEEACIDEIKTMISYHVGHYVNRRDLPRDAYLNIIHSFMFIKHKTKPNGMYDKTKARLVGNGKLQKDHTYDLVSSSTVALSSVFMLFNIASYFRAFMASYDVKGAFLNAQFGPNDVTTYLKINAEVAKIWVKCDPKAKEFMDHKGELLLQLDKFIYGLKQSPYKFQKHLQAFFLRHGYIQMINDDCIYVKRVGVDWSIISTHVDDILQVSTQQSLVNELHEALIEEYKSITFHENAESYIGMTIERSEDKSEIVLTQKGLLDKINDEYIPNENVMCSTPCSSELFEHTRVGGTPMDRSKYLGLVMSLMYLGRLTRPDILLPTTFLATKGHNAVDNDFNEAKKICRYLKSTRELGIKIHCTDMQLNVSCDASYQVHTDLSGHTGYVIGLGPNSSYLHARSGKQKINTSSSTESEVVAMADCLKTVIWIRNLLSELDVTPLRSILIKQDNQAAITLATEDCATKGTKHILGRVYYVRSLCKDGVVEIEYCPTEKMVADVLTKPLHGTRFLQHRSALLNVPLNDNERLKIANASVRVRKSATQR